MTFLDSFSSLLSDIKQRKKSNKLYIGSRFSLPRHNIGIYFRLSFNILWVNMEMWRWKVRKSLDEKASVEGEYMPSHHVWFCSVRAQAIKSNSQQAEGKFVMGEFTYIHLLCEHLTLSLFCIFPIFPAVFCNLMLKLFSWIRHNTCRK